MKQLIIFLLLLSTIGWGAPELSQKPELLKQPVTQKITVDEGHVSCFLNLTKTGSVEKMMILESSDPALEPAVTAMKDQLNFNPAHYRGQAVPVRVYVTISFKEKKLSRVTITKMRGDKRYKAAVAAIDAEGSGNSGDRKGKKSFAPENTTEKTKKETQETPPNPLFDKEGEKKEKLKAPTLSKLPKLIKFVRADYPEALFKAKVEGQVMVFIDIDDKGTISQVGVINSTHKDFVTPAIKAIKQFIFTPGEFEKKPVPVRITYQYHFKVKDEQQASQEEIDLAKKKKQLIVEEKDYDSIRGKVISYGDREPVSTALVNAVGIGGQYEAYTDDNGKFLFQNLPDGEYTIVVPKNDHFLQYETKEMIKKGIVLNMSIYLPKDNVNQYEMTVISNKGKKEVTKQVITVQELMKVPGTGGDAVKVIKNLPGVSRTGSFSGELAVRGGQSSDTMVYVDGQFVPLLFHFGGLSSIINSEVIADVSYLPGGYSVQYGRVLGGTVDVKTRKINTTKDAKNVHGYFDIDLIDTSAMVEIPIDETSGIAFAFRRSYIDKVIEWFAPSDLIGSGVVLPVYYDWQIKYNKQITKKDLFSIMFFGSSDELRLVLDQPVKDANLVGEFGFKTTLMDINAIWDHKHSSKFKFNVNVAIQYDAFDINLGEFIKAEMHQFPLSYRTHFEWKLSNEIRLSAGTDGIVAWYDYKVTAPDTRPDKNSGEFMPLGTYKTVHKESSSSVWMPGFYTEATFDWKGLRLIPGLRFDTDTTSKKKWSIDPRLAALYTFNKDWMIKGSIGRYSQRPGDEGNFTKEFGNPELDYQHAIQYTAGFEYRFTDFIRGTVEFFLYDNQELMVSTDKMNENNEPLHMDNSGASRAYGMEIFLRHTLSRRFFGWISYTLMKSEIKDGSTGEWELAQYDQTHIFTAIGSWKLPYNYEVGFRLRYTTGNPTTPINGSVYDSDSRDYIPIYGKPNSVRDDAFFQLDIRIDKTWQYKYWKLALYLDVQNATYQKNQEGIEYNFDYSESAKVTGLPIFPSIGIKGEF